MEPAAKPIWRILNANCFKKAFAEYSNIGKQIRVNVLLSDRRAHAGGEAIQAAGDK